MRSSIGSPIFEGKASAKGLQFRIALVHDLVTCGGIGSATDVAAESGYKAHGITEPSGLGESFFFA